MTTTTGVLCVVVSQVRVSTERDIKTDTLTMNETVSTNARLCTQPVMRDPGTGFLMHPYSPCCVP